jgi:phosphoserine phosphatase
MKLIAFDVDGTLRSAFGDDISPIEDARTLMVIFHAWDCKILLWSGSGELYARQVARQCGVAHLVDYYAHKSSSQYHPDITFDDEDVTLGTVNIRLP